LLYKAVNNLNHIRQHHIDHAALEHTILHLGRNMKWSQKVHAYTYVPSVMERWKIVSEYTWLVIDKIINIQESPNSLTPI
jgi:hypothetical protein